MTTTSSTGWRNWPWKWIIAALVLLLLGGGLVADRFLKGKGHAGIGRMVVQVLRNYPKSWSAKAPHVSLTVSEKNMAKILAVVDSARARGVILAEGNDYVKGELTDVDGTFKVKLRIKGKMTDHVSGSKWSFRVIARDTGDFLGMLRFSLQHPGTRGYLNDWLYHRMMKGEGLVAMRYGFCTLDLNGDELGVYAYEEHFGQELLDNNQRPRGPLLRFDPEEFWQKRLLWMRKEKVPPGLGTYQSAKVDAYDSKDILADSVRRMHFDSAVARIDRFRSGAAPASAVFDADRIARHLANNDLIGGHRSLDWSDVKFYYNPATGLVEPVSYESFSGFPTTELVGEHQMTGAFNVKDDLHTQWLKDTLLFALYIHHLERFSRKEYMDSTFAALAPAMDSASAILYAEFPWKELDKSLYYRNQEVLRKALDEGAKVAMTVEQRASGPVLVVRSSGAFPLRVEAVMTTGGAWVSPLADGLVYCAKDEGKASVKEMALPPDVVLTGTRVRYRVPGSRKVLEMVVGGR
jgi:hypothetical protein